MTTLITLLYLLAAVTMLAVVARAPSRRAWAVMVLALLAVFEEQHWFLPLFIDTTAWPETTLTSLFSVAWAGVNGPTDMAHFVVIAIGRLLMLLTLFYSLVALFYYGAAWRARFMAWGAAARFGIGIWLTLMAAAFIIQVVGQETTVDAATIIRVGAAIAVSTYAGITWRALIRAPRGVPSSSSPETL